MITFGQRLAAVVAGSLLLLSVVGAAPAAAKAPSWSHRDAHVCGQPGAGKAHCTSVARSFYVDGHPYQTRTKKALADAAAAARVDYVTGTSIRTAYGLTAEGDPSLVVAIVDAYDDPSAFANLTRFRTDSGLPAIQSCSLATLTTLTSSAGSPCFTKTNQTGGTSLPSADAGWSNEIDLDLQAASAVCPMCSILLLEATSSSVANLATAVTTASNTAHVRSISNSYGVSGDYPGTIAPAYDNAAMKGIAVTASAGDGGFGPLFPASATNVIGVGGTTLSVDATGVRSSEAAWAGTGSGCSRYNSAPAWQSISGNPCAGKKAISDLSADADPNSGLATYTTYSGVTGYWVFGGTSLSSPLIAGLYALQGGYSVSNLAGQYAWAAGTPYSDVTSGANGTCSPSVLCTAGVGWDGPTGRGSLAGPTASPALTTIGVSPANASVQTGGTKQFTASGKDQFGQPMSPQPAFAWSVTGGGTIDASSGLFTAGSTAGGPFTVTASSGSVSGTASVTVTAPPVLTTISVSPANVSVQTGGTQQFSATGKDQFGQAMSPQPAFAWSVTGGGTINASSGLFTAGSTAGGPFTVTASSGSVSGTASVTVTSAPPDFSLSVSPPSQSVSRGATATYTVTITPAFGFNGAVTLSLTGQPSGSTVTFSPNPATGTSASLTIKTRSTTSRQTYTLSINGVSGSLSHSTSMSLKVTR